MISTLLFKESFSFIIQIPLLILFLLLFFILFLLYRSLFLILYYSPKLLIFSVPQGTHTSPPPSVPPGPNKNMLQETCYSGKTYKYITS